MLFPSINFTCKGYIQKWIFSGDFEGTQTSRYELPEPQIWEKNGENVYHLRASSGFHTIIKPITKTADGRVEYIPNSNFPINAGAVLGLLIRSKYSDNYIQFHFLEHSSYATEYYYFDTSPNPDLQTSFNTTNAIKEKRYVPLITIELCKFHFFFFWHI